MGEAHWDAGIASSRRFLAMTCLSLLVYWFISLLVELVELGNGFIR
jgi:hypothetical protein